jgi:hypothetical protein
MNDAEISDNNNSSGTGGISILSNGKANINNGKIIGNIGFTGGGINVSNGILNLNGAEIRNNTASGNGGGIHFNNTATININGDVYFSDNIANTPYWIRKDSTNLYNGKTATDWKNLYNIDLAPFIKSLSNPPLGESPFQYVFNNFDISYVGTQAAKISPEREQIVFDSSTNVANLIYGGYYGIINQFLSLTSEKPTINILNTKGDLWVLKVSYEELKVNSVIETELKFALRNDGNQYDIFNANTPTTIFEATIIWTPNYITTIDWGNGTDDLLKVFLPKNRFDLVSQPINGVINWSLEIIP